MICACNYVKWRGAAPAFAAMRSLRSAAMALQLRRPPMKFACRTLGCSQLARHVQTLADAAQPGSTALPAPHPLLPRQRHLRHAISAAMLQARPAHAVDQALLQAGPAVCSLYDGANAVAMMAHASRASAQQLPSFAPTLRQVSHVWQCLAQSKLKDWARLCVLPAAALPFPGQHAAFDVPAREAGLTLALRAASATLYALGTLPQLSPAHVQTYKDIHHVLQRCTAPASRSAEAAAKWRALLAQPDHARMLVLCAEHSVAAGLFARPVLRGIALAMLQDDAQALHAAGLAYAARLARALVTARCAEPHDADMWRQLLCVLQAQLQSAGQQAEDALAPQPAPPVVAEWSAEEGDAEALWDEMEQQAPVPRGEPGSGIAGALAAAWCEEQPEQDSHAAAAARRVLAQLDVPSKTSEHPQPEPARHAASAVPWFSHAQAPWLPSSVPVAACVPQQLTVLQHASQVLKIGTRSRTHLPMRHVQLLSSLAHIHVTALGLSTERWAVPLIAAHLPAPIPAACVRAYDTLAPAAGCITARQRQVLLDTLRSSARQVLAPQVPGTPLPGLHTGWVSPSKQQALHVAAPADYMRQCLPGCDVSWCSAASPARKQAATAALRATPPASSQQTAGLLPPAREHASSSALQVVVQVSASQLVLPSSGLPPALAKDVAQRSLQPAEIAFFKALSLTHGAGLALKLHILQAHGWKAAVLPFDAWAAVPSARRAAYLHAIMAGQLR